MSKWLWIGPMLVAAAWSQTRSGMPNILPVTPPGGLVIPSGTVLNVRVDETLDTNRNQPGDRFTATLTDPLVVNGQAALPAGTHLTGHVLENKPAGIFRGHARLMLGLDSFLYKGHSYPIDLTAATCKSDHKHGKLKNPDPNAGAVVGNREQVIIPAETVVHFTLGSPVRV